MTVTDDVTAWRQSVPSIFMFNSIMVESAKTGQPGLLVRSAKIGQPWLPVKSAKTGRRGLPVRTAKTGHK